MTIYVAINYSTTEKIGRDHPKKWQYNNGFVDQELNSLRDLMIQVWRGYPYCAQHHHIHRLYTDKFGAEKKTAFRHSLNYLRSNVVSLDFDDETESSSIDELSRDLFIYAYAGALYSTRSSKPEKPRTRVLFETEEAIEDPDYYRALNEAILWRYGKADQSCKDVCRIFAGSPDCTVKVQPGKILTKTHCDAIVSQYVAHEMEKLAARQAVRDNAMANGGADIRTAQEALKYLDGDTLPYSDYLKILSAIWSQFPGPEGEALAESWAGERRKPDVEDKWRHGFNGSVTIMTLFWMARQNGWPGALTFESDKQRADYYVRKMMQKYQ